VIEKQWNMKPLPEQRELAELKTAINAGPALASLLLQRGLRDFNAVKAFFLKNPREMHDPFLMKDMDRAVERITKAVEQSERILVYGDYDVDGTSAVALLYGFLETHHEQVSYYIPDRYGEGYGVSTKGVEYAHDNEFGLIIALDCGVKAHEQVSLAKSLGIDFIICDHHLPPETLPEAVAILNPLQSDCAYPYKNLCGCGIGFKLTQALCHTWELEPEEAYKNLDLVAIATSCDIVSMTGENRLLTSLGIDQLNHAMRPGLEALMPPAVDSQGREPTRSFSVSDIVFKIGPKINAAGRMKHGSMAVELLTARHSNEAEKHASVVTVNNTERQQVDKEMLSQALKMLEASGDYQSRKSTVLYNPDWHKGVVGIAASRIQEHHYRPTIVLTESNGHVSGSARSVRGFDVHAAIEKCADLLLTYGGHRAAAGLTMKHENLELFIRRFEEAVARVITEEQLVPCIDVDVEVSFTDLTDKFYHQMMRLAPFGPDNMRPIFVSRNVVALPTTRVVGADKTHLKLDALQASSNKQFASIGFGMAHFYDALMTGKSFDMAYSLTLNEFRGVSSLQLEVKDIKIND